MDIKQAIKAELKESIENAISCDELLRILDFKYHFKIPERVLRDTIADIVLNENELIGSCSNGFYRIVNEKDMNIAYHFLVDPIALTAKRAEKLKWLWKVRNIGELDLGA